MQPDKYLCIIRILSPYQPVTARTTVTTMSTLWDGQLWFDSTQGQNIPLFSKTPKLALGLTQPSMQWLQWSPSTGIKQLLTDHSPPPSAKVQNAWSYISTPPYSFMACTRTTLSYNTRIAGQTLQRMALQLCKGTS